MLKLILTYQGRTYQVDPDNTPFTIGRLPQNDLCLEYDFVTGRHGRITLQDKEFVYEDLNTTNGTNIQFADGADHFIRKSTIVLRSRGSIRFGGRSEAEAEFVVAESRSKEKEEQPSIETGLTCIQAGDFKTAFHIFENLVKTRPDFLSGYYYAGFTAFYLEHHETAILYFERYLTLKPQDNDVRVDLGKIYERIGKMEMAVACYRKVIKTDPGHQEAQKRLNEITRFQGGVPLAGRELKTRDIIGENLVANVEMNPFYVTYNLAYHGRILNDVLKALKIYREEVGRKLSHDFEGVIPVALLKPLGEVSGRTGPGGIVLMVDQEHLGEKLFLSVLVTHEYAHYALGILTGFSAYVPWWLQEGFAQHMSQNITPDRLNNIAALAGQKRLIPLAALEKGPGDIPDRDLLGIAYLEAHSAVAFLIKQHGYEGLRKLIEALNKKQNIRKAFRYMGLDYERFERDWAGWLAESVESGTVKLTREINFHRRGAEDAEKE